MKYLFVWLISIVFVFSDEADDIVKAVEKNLRGDYMYAQMRMIVTSKRGQRTVKVESWSQGDKKASSKFFTLNKTWGSHF